MAHFFRIIRQDDIILLYIVRNGQDIARIAGHRIAQLLNLEHIIEMLGWVARSKHKEEVFEIRQSIRLEVAEKGDVILMLERITEAQCVQS